MNLKGRRKTEEYNTHDDTSITPTFRDENLNYSLASWISRYTLFLWIISVKTSFVLLIEYRSRGKHTSH